MRFRRLLAVILLVGLVSMTGCQTHFAVVFRNETASDLRLTLRGPGTIVPAPAGMPIAKRGGEAVFDVSVDRGLLPTRYKWDADGHTGTIIVTKEGGDQFVRLVNGEVQVRARL